MSTNSQENAVSSRKERPILFSGPMVRAILDGRKTQTRRVVKPQPESAGFGRNCIVRPYCTGTVWPLAYYERRGACWNSSARLRCHYGQPGDHLWVRETWAYVPVTAYQCSEGVQQSVNPSDSDMAAVYASGWDRRPRWRWRPSIHMPRWASRITLEIEAVRVERVQDISEPDAQQEGIESVHCENFGAWRNYAFKTAHTMAKVAVNDEHHRIVGYQSAIRSFRSLWDSINDKRGFGWVTNPWVWVIQFKRVDGVTGAEGGGR